jgi:hypothetical protein
MQKFNIVKFHRLCLFPYVILDPLLRNNFLLNLHSAVVIASILQPLMPLAVIVEILFDLFNLLQIFFISLLELTCILGKFYKILTDLNDSLGLFIDLLSILFNECFVYFVEDL